MKRSDLRESGQSTVEFALTLVLLMGLIFFFLQLSMVFGFGNYAHYATFMAARAYLSSGPDEGDQRSRAERVTTRMLGASGNRFKMIAEPANGGIKIGAGDQFSETDRRLSWQQGVRYTFKSRLFIVPMAGGARRGEGVNALTLTSESWLGREPTYQECAQEMGRLKGRYDNGC